MWRPARHPAISVKGTGGNACAYFFSRNKTLALTGIVAMIPVALVVNVQAASLHKGGKVIWDCCS